MTDEQEKPVRGRPRSTSADEAILNAARNLVMARGYDAVTTSEIASAAGVGKQTIYRRWPSKADLVLQSFVTLAAEEVVVEIEGNLSDRLHSFLTKTSDALRRTAPAVRSLMMTAQTDPDFRESFKQKLIEPRRAALRTLLDEAGNAKLVEAAVISVYGAIWYRLLLDEPVDTDFAKALSELVTNGLSAQ
ncbi:MAG: TetR/AcrR family transcriptional regulator [Rhizobiales bacterium]|nr:TetR/AcrR family transcriptional regulator [Hyphomicrobiales bacterium]